MNKGNSIHVNQWRNLPNKPIAFRNIIADNLHTVILLQHSGGAWTVVNPLLMIDETWLGIDTDRHWATLSHDSGERLLLVSSFIHSTRPSRTPWDCVRPGRDIRNGLILGCFALWWIKRVGMFIVWIAGCRVQPRVIVLHVAISRDRILILKERPWVS